jgi:imidazoleglycerol-phosphate dehydratase
MITIERNTKETRIKLSLGNRDLPSTIHTPYPFLNHMLDAFSFYANLTLTIDATGDIDVDDHHLVEDIGIVLGQALLQYKQTLHNIHRFGFFYMPMDESLSRIALDFSNRPTLIYEVSFKNERIANMTLDNFKEFFKALTYEARITLHISNLYGENDHHKIESIFKGFGKCVFLALREVETLQSTKGVL